MPRPKKFNTEQVVDALKQACQANGGAAVYVKSVADVLQCNQLTAARYLNNIQHPSVVHEEVGKGELRKRTRWLYQDTNTVQAEDSEFDDEV